MTAQGPTVVVMSQRPSAAGTVLLTVTESVERLGVSRATFYRLVQQGTIRPALRWGSGRGRPFFDPSDLDQYRNPDGGTAA